MPKTGGLCCLTVAIAFHACSTPDSLPENHVRISAGVVEGVPAAEPGVRMFLGIPYAAPPVGELRWKRPQPTAAWTGVRQASQFGERCIRTNPFPDMLFRSTSESEDCLSLSVWTPAAPANTKLPGMVWIHGGGFFSGAGDEQRHEGSVLASKGVIVVAINYRLNVLGFFAHPDLTAESSNHASGNYGLLDQIAALQWVQDNIAAFAGDPGNVTIFGESAGSIAVSALMASPLARGLFHKAIGQSGSIFSVSRQPLPSLAEVEQRGTAMAESLGATSLAELRSAAPAKLAAAIVDAPTTFWPSVDGFVMPDDPSVVFAAGKQNDVPLLAGWNSAELKRLTQTVSDFTARLRDQFPDDYESAQTLYPSGNDDEAKRSVVALAGDNFIVYSTWRWIEAHAASGRSAIYRYLFDQLIPLGDDDPHEGYVGAGHAEDIEFVFHTLESKDLAWRESDRQVADLMVNYWTNFAKSGDPNSDGLAAWPPWDATGERFVMRINDSAAAEPEQHRDRYEFLERLEKRQQGE